MTFSILILALATQWIGSRATCPTLPVLDPATGCYDCVSEVGCKFCTVESGNGVTISPTRYGCTTDFRCNGITGASQTFFGDLNDCDCPAKPVVAAATMFKDAYFPINMMNGWSEGLKYLHFQVTGPTTFDVYPATVGLQLDVYVTAFNGTGKRACSSNATSIVTATKTGTFQSLEIPAGEATVTIRGSVETGVESLVSGDIAYRTCGGDVPCDEVCHGACDVATEWCQNDAGDAPPDANEYRGYRCCKIGFDDEANCELRGSAAAGPPALAWGVFLSFAGLVWARY